MKLPRQANRDANAASKLCNIVSARAFGLNGNTTQTYFSFDPGLMPGTGLAREHGAVVPWIWKNLPRLSSVLLGTSSTERQCLPICW